MKVLVTGANGFIGSNLCAALIKKGATVHALVRKSSNLEFLDPIKKSKNLKLFYGDITEPATLPAAMKGVSLVYHVAASVSDWGLKKREFAINEQGVKNVFDAAIAAKAKRVVHFSSVSVYGFGGCVDGDEDMKRPNRPWQIYVQSKRAGEKAALSYQDRIEVVVIRPAQVYGPNDRTTMLQIVPQIEKGALPHVGGGKAYCCPCYIDNLLEAALAAGSAPAKIVNGKYYHIMDSRVNNGAANNKITWRQHNDIISDLLGTKPIKASVPTWLSMSLACILDFFGRIFSPAKSPMINKYRVLAVAMNSNYSVARAAKDLKYKGKVTTLDGLKKTIDWYKEYKKTHKV